MSWIKTTFGEFCDIQPSVKLQKGKEYSFVPMEDINPGISFIESNQEKIFTGGGARFCKGDTLFARITPCLENGKVAFVSKLATNCGFGSTEYYVFRARPAVSDPKFLFYLAKSSKIVEPAIKSMVGSSGRQRARKEVIQSVELECPNLPTQERIAAILSAYDELIENNRRRIALLEHAARLLYREWFVHFRFPGHETANFVDGLPEGWVEKTLYDVVNVLSGGTPKTGTSEYWGNEIPFFTPKDTGDLPYTYDTEKMITEKGLRNCNSRLYGKNTLFITARGTVGKLRLAQRPMAMNQSCYALQSKTNLSQQFLYFAISERVNHLKGRAAGAIFDAIVVDTFKKIPVIIPSSDVTGKFSQFASNTLDQIDNLSAQNRNLTKARDLLLPRLMDGRIPV